jgi:hypothetical protein
MNLKISKPEALLLVRMLERLWLDEPEWKVYHVRERLLRLLDREGPSLSPGQKKRARYLKRQARAAIAKEIEAGVREALKSDVAKGILNAEPPAT